MTSNFYFVPSTLGVLILLYLRSVDAVVNYNITNFAGNGTFGFSGDNGPAQSASMKIVKGVWVSTANSVYISDTTNFKVRVVDPFHIITTFTGISSTPSGDGGAVSSASVAQPWGLHGDSAHTFYITSFSANSVRSVDLSTGIIGTLAGSGTASPSTTATNGDGGLATAATFNGPTYVVADSIGNVYIADTNNNRVRKVDASNIITTVAGSGTYGAGADGLPATTTSFKGAAGLWVDTIGNIFVGDGGYKLRQMDVNSGTGITVAGTGLFGTSGNNGKATAALLTSPVMVWGNTVSQLFLTTGNQVRVIDQTTSIISLVAGSTTSGHSGDGAMAVDALLHSPLQFFGTPTGHYYVADSSNSVVRQLQIAPIAPTQQPTTIAPTTSRPTLSPTSSKPTVVPTTTRPTFVPSTRVPTMPTFVPTPLPSEAPTTALPSEQPTILPTRIPTAPTQFPALKPSPGPTPRPTFDPTPQPTRPTVVPTSAMPTTTKPSALPTTAAPSQPTVVPTSHFPSVKPSSGFPSFIPPSPVPTACHPSQKPTRSPTTHRPSYVPTASPTQPFKDIGFESTLCFHHLSVATLAPRDEVVIALAVSETLDLNSSLVYVIDQTTMGKDSVTTYQICVDVYCQARTLDYYWVVDSNATQLYFGLRHLFDESVANLTFTQILNDTAIAYNATNLRDYSQVDVARYSSFEILVYIPPTYDDWLSPEEVGSVTAISIVATLVCLSLGLAVCSVMEEKGF